MIRKRRVFCLEKFLGVNESCDFARSLTGEARGMVNYRVTGDFSLKKRGGYSFVTSHANSPITTIWYGAVGGQRKLFYIAGGRLYTLDTEGSQPQFIGTVGAGRAEMFSFGDFVYILNGTDYYRYNGSALSVVEGYVPTVMINSSPDGKGTAFEDANMLTGKAAQLYNGTGSSTVFKLGKKGVGSVVSVKVDGEAVGFTFDAPLGTVTLTSPPSEGLNNVEIIYNQSATNRGRITGCNSAVFCGGGNDTRLMVWGNSDADFAQFCFYSELAEGVSNVEYFPEANFINLSGQRINDIVRHYDRQIIFTDKGAYFAYASSVTDALGTVRSIFPVFTLSSEKGSVAPGQAVVIDNYPVTIWHDGVYKWVSTNIRDERNAKLISERVHQTFARLLPDPEHQSCLMMDFENRGELWVVAGGEAMIYNYRQDLWYIYNNINAACLVGVGDDVWFGTPEGKIGVFREELTSDNGMAIGCIWETPFTSFGDAPRKKELRDVIIMHGARDDRTDVYWKTDDQRGDTAPFSAGLAPVGNGPVVEELRIGARHLNAAKLTLISDTINTGSHIVSLSVGIVQGRG